MTEIRRILHPTDFSEHSAAAAEYASLLAQLCDAELHLLYVIESAMGKMPEPELKFPSPGESAEVSAEVWPRLREVVGLGTADSEKIVLATRLGKVDDQIIAYADANNVGMIVIGTHGRQGIVHAVMGSVAEAVVQKANCPVLSVKAGNAGK